MMEENIKDTGKMVNNTEKVNFINQIKRYGKKVFGAMEDAFHGKIQSLLN
jgi:RecA/RadA recombinase